MVSSDYDKEGEYPVDFIKPEVRYKTKTRTNNILRFIPRDYEINKLQREKKDRKSRRCFIRKRYKENLSLSTYEEVLDDIEHEYTFIPILNSKETVHELERRLDKKLGIYFDRNSTKQHLLRVFKHFYLRQAEILRQEETREETKKINKINADRMEKVYLPILLQCYEKDTYSKEQLFKILKTELRKFNDTLKQLRKKEKLKNETHKLMMTISLLGPHRFIRKK